MTHVRIILYHSFAYGTFDMKIYSFIGSQLVTLSYSSKVAVWQSMTQPWKVTTSL